MTEQIYPMIITGAAAVTMLFFVIWLIHLALKNAGVVDIGWGLGFILLCGIDVMLGNGFNLRNTLLFIMVTLWGLRIALFLIKRIAVEKDEDRRYQKIRQEWGNNIALKFFFFFEFQAVLQLIIAVPFVIVSMNAAPGLSVFEVLGVLVFIIALIGETMADEQLHHFKADPVNKGKTCRVGLWRYSRHPNYFFEWLIWMGIFIFSLGSPNGWIAFISPLVMFYLMMYVSGVPLAEEQSLRSRGDDYRRYQKTTSIFFPMPPKKEMSL